MNIQEHVYQALRYIGKPVSPQELHERARELRFTPAKLGVALRALERRGIVVRTEGLKTSEHARYTLTELARDVAVKRQQEAQAEAETKPPRPDWFTLVAEGEVDETILDAVRRCGFRLRSSSAVMGLQKFHFEREAGDGGRVAG